jgi:hypothetical protein
MLNALPQSNRQSKIVILLLVGILALQAVNLSVLVLNNLNGQGSAHVNNSQSLPMIIVQAGTAYLLDVYADHKYVQFSLNNPAEITGQFTSTNNATMFIMTPAQFADFTSNRTLFFYYSTSGYNTIPGVIKFGLPLGNYYLVFYNSNYTQNTVTVTQSVIATPI